MTTTSSPSITRIGRPADRQDLIVQEIREQIVGGQLSPGSRLPTRSEIEQKYGAGANTVQRALDRLKQDGFILSSGRNGTHVSFEPPHLTRYAVVFPTTPGGPESWLRFWTALSNEAIGLQQRQNLKLPLYYGVGSDSHSEDYQKLLADVLAHRVAGIIFATTPHFLVGTPLLDEPGIPRIAIMTPTHLMPFPAISPDVTSFFVQAFIYLQGRGCKKVAFLNPSGVEARMEQALQEMESYGLTTQSFWQQSVHVTQPHTARNLAHLMMNTAQKDRPDALIVGDDNMVEYATAGLVAAGVRVPQELEVVAHCNFPYPTPSVVPVKRLGFNAREVLQKAIENIDSMRRGVVPPSTTLIPARFEDELDAG